MCLYFVRPLVPSPNQLPARVTQLSAKFVPNSACKPPPLRSPFSEVPLDPSIVKNFMTYEVRPPGIEWKMGRNPKMGKNWPKNRNGPRPEMVEKMAQKWQKNRKMTPNPILLPFLGHFFPISGRGVFSIFWPIFSHFWISAHFPFYTRRPDS